MATPNKKTTTCRKFFNLFRTRESDSDSKKNKSEKKLKQSRITEPRYQTRRQDHIQSLVEYLDDSSNLQDYLAGYPDLVDDKHVTDNLDFYSGKIESVPDGDLIDNIHKNWHGKYDKLERHHGYIQWLFPIRVKGLNFDAEPLQLHEIEAMKKDELVMERLHKSYELMLDFYGIKMVDRKTGQLHRHKNYASRFENLEERAHNWLRITRILQCLGEFGFTSYQEQLLVFLANEIFKTKMLRKLAKSYSSFWVHTIKDEMHRLEFIDNIKDLIQKHY